MDCVRLLVVVALVCSISRSFVHAMGGLSPVGALFTQWKDGNDAKLGGVQGTYALCALTADTLVTQCWGAFSRRNDTVSPNFTTILVGLNSGDSFSCGLTYRTNFPVCWGSRPDSNNSVPSHLENVSYSSMSVGGFHVCALRSSGQVDCWGSNNSRQASPPTNINFFSIACGQSFCCGLNREGEASCWGGDLPPKPPSAYYFSSIFAGGFHACGILQNTGQTYCWGDNTYNQSWGHRNYNFSTLALGYYHSCGIRKDNRRVFCWGDDTYSQVSSALVNEPFSSITSADLYTCGMSSQDVHTVKCWGNSFTNFSDNPFKVSRGLCASSCSNQQYELRECPDPGDTICIDCATQCGAVNQSSSCSCNNNTRDDNRGSSSSSLGVALGPGIGGGVVFIVLLVLATWYYYDCLKSPFKAYKRKHWESIVSFSRSELQVAMHNFRNDMIIGRGTQGVVYKGILPDGRVVAIKKAQAMPDDKNLFLKELNLLGRLHHSCLVKLIGYCYEEKIMVYEFLENGSLSDCLFDLVTRIKISAQVARGLEYLHTYASPPIIHRDVKASNILLDRDWNAHVSDFGLSVFGPQSDASHLSCVTVAGTPGYLDPQYWQTKRLTSSSDVYSFGIVLFELLTGKTATEVMPSTLRIQEIHEFLDSRKDFLDSRLGLRGTDDHSLIHTVLGLAFACTSDDPKLRPTMGFVVTTVEALLSNTQGATKLAASVNS